MYFLNHLPLLKLFGEFGEDFHYLETYFGFDKKYNEALLQSGKIGNIKLINFFLNKVENDYQQQPAKNFLYWLLHYNHHETFQKISNYCLFNKQYCKKINSAISELYKEKATLIRDCLYSLVKKKDLRFAETLSGTLIHLTINNMTCKKNFFGQQIKINSEIIDCIKFTVYCSDTYYSSVYFPDLYITFPNDYENLIDKRNYDISSVSFINPKKEIDFMVKKVKLRDKLNCRRLCKECFLGLLTGKEFVAQAVWRCNKKIFEKKKPKRLFSYPRQYQEEYLQFKYCKNFIKHPEKPFCSTHMRQYSCFTEIFPDALVNILLQFLIE
jgi:hypothetical protein